MNEINPFSLMIALFGVTIWHELGHLVAAHWLGVRVVNFNVGFGPIVWQHRLHRRLHPDKPSPVAKFVLRGLPLGMSIALPHRTANDGHALRPDSHDLWIAVAGPVASLGLTLLLFAVARWTPMPYEWAYGLVGLGLLSAAVALLNLLPIPGLDGGHMLLLFLAHKGWKLTPAREIRLHRAGVRWLITLCLGAVLYILWRAFFNHGMM